MKMVGLETLYKLQITYYKPGWEPMTDHHPPQSHRGGRMGMGHDRQGH